MGNIEITMELALTLEQKFKLEQIKKQAEMLSKQELEKYVVELCRQSMARENILKQLDIK